MCPQNPDEMNEFNWMPIERHLDFIYTDSPVQPLNLVCYKTSVRESPAEGMVVVKQQASWSLSLN